MADPILCAAKIDRIEVDLILKDRVIEIVDRSDKHLFTFRHSAINGNERGLLATRPSPAPGEPPTKSSSGQEHKSSHRHGIARKSSWTTVARNGNRQKAVLAVTAVR